MVEYRMQLAGRNVTSGCHKEATIGAMLLALFQPGMDVTPNIHGLADLPTDLLRPPRKYSLSIYIRVLRPHGLPVGSPGGVAIGWQQKQQLPPSLGACCFMPSDVACEGSLYLNHYQTPNKNTRLFGPPKSQPKLPNSWKLERRLDLQTVCTRLMVAWLYLG